MYYRYIYIYYTCRRSSHCSLRTFHMVYTDIHLRSVSSKPRPDEPKEPKKWVEIHVLWIRFAMFFLGGTPKKLGEIKKSHEEHSMFFLFTKNWNREMMCCFLFVCVIDCAWIIFFFGWVKWFGVLRSFHFISTVDSWLLLLHDSPVSILNEPFRSCTLCWGWS